MTLNYTLLSIYVAHDCDNHVIEVDMWCKRMARAVLICLFTYLWCLAEVGVSCTRDNIIRKYFEIGFSYHVILCFLVTLHGIYIYIYII